MNAILSVVVLYRFFDIFFQRKYQNGISVISWFFLIIWHFALQFGINNLKSYQLLLVNMIIIIIVCLNNYLGQRSKRIIFPMIICAIWSLIEFIIAYLSILFNITVIPISSAFWGSFISKLILLILITYLKKIFSSVMIQEQPDNRDVIFLLLIPVGNLFVMHTMFMVSLLVEQNSILIYSIISSFIILLINFYIFRFYLKLIEESELKRYNTVYKKQLELVNQHIEEKEAVANELKKSKHNMKQNLVFLRELAIKKEHQAMIEHLDQLFEDTIKPDGISHTGNTVVDSLINYKYSIARANNIDFHVELNIPEEMDFLNSDLCILLGNVLDNALEAVIRDHNKDSPYIKINMVFEKGVLVITAVNSFDGILKRNRKGDLISVKEDNENHGIGLNSIQKVVNKYQGSLLIKIIRKEFALRILMYTLEKKNICYGQSSN